MNRQTAKSSATRKSRVGGASDEELYFAYSATLRIFGNILNMEDISANLGLQPTYSHRKQDKRLRGKEFGHDMWAYSPSLRDSDPLEKHIDTLWNTLRPHKNYLLALKRSLTIDVFLSYRSNCDHCGVEISHTCLGMFVELKIPLGLSIIVA